MTIDIETPLGWAICTIDNVVAHDGVFTDGDWVETKDQDPMNGDVRLIQLADIGDGNFRDKSARFLTKPKAYQLNCAFLSEGDLLVARMPDPLGRCCIFPLLGDEKYVTVVDVCDIRLGSSHVNRKYMMHLINSPAIRAAIAALQSGSTRKRISRKNLATISLPIAPINEQDRIVAKIEELFSELDKGIESLETAREQLKVYRQAVLKHAFEGELTEKWRAENKDKLESAEQLLARIQKEREASYQQQIEEWKDAVKAWEKKGKERRKPTKPKKHVVTGSPVIPDDLAKYCSNCWSWMKLEDISEVSGGLTKNQKRNTLPTKMKYLRVANVYADKLLLDEITEIGVTEEELQKLKLVAGDLLVVEGNGSIDQIGRLAVWSGEIGQIGHQNHLIRVRLIGGMLPRFFLLFLLSPLGRKFIIKQASSTTGLHTLSITKVSGLAVPVPNLHEQETLLTEVDEMLSQIDRMESDISAEEKRSEALRQAILKKAFSGQLVEQDPNDEPVTILLEHIKAEKAKQAKPGKKKKRKTAA